MTSDPEEDPGPARAGPAATGQGPPLALAALGTGLLLGYALELSITLRDGPEELESFLHAFGLVPRELLDGRVFTLVTAIFLHADSFHLLSNLVFLGAFGFELEPRIGARRFAGLFFGCGLAAGLIHVASSADSFLPTVGASGAVSGVLGAWWRLRHDPGAPTRFLGAGSARALLALWIGAQVAAGLTGASGASGGVGEAGWAHLGGFAAGLAVAPRLRRVRTRTP